MQFRKRQQAAQVVAAVQRAQPFDRAAAWAAGGRGLVGDLVCELVAQPAGRARVGLDQVRGVKAGRRPGGGIAGQFVGDRFAGQRVAVGAVGLDRVGDKTFGVGDEGFFLFVLVNPVQWAHSRPAAIAGGGLLEHVAVRIDLKGQRVLDTRVGRVALVVVIDRLQRVGKEDSVAVAATGLNSADAEVLLGDGVGGTGALDLIGAGVGSSVVGVVSWRSIDPFRPRQASRSSSALRSAGSTVSGSNRALAASMVIRARGSTRGSNCRDTCSRPLKTPVWNHVLVCIGGTCEAAAIFSPGGYCAAAGQRGELLGVPLLDHAEAAEFPLVAVEVAVVIGVAGDETVAADVIEGLRALDHVHRERQPGDPGFAVALSCR